MQVTATYSTAYHAAGYSYLRYMSRPDTACTDLRGQAWVLMSAKGPSNEGWSKGISCALRLVRWRRFDRQNSRPAAQSPNGA